MKWNKYRLTWLPVNKLTGVSPYATPGQNRNDDLAECIRSYSEEHPIDVVAKDDSYYIIAGQDKASMYINASDDQGALIMCRVYAWDDVSSIAMEDEQFSEYQYRQNRLLSLPDVPVNKMFILDALEMMGKLCCSDEWIRALCTVNIMLKAFTDEQWKSFPNNNECFEWLSDFFPKYGGANRYEQ